MDELDQDVFEDLGVAGVDFCEVAIRHSIDGTIVEESHVSRCPVCARRRLMHTAQLFNADVLQADEIYELLEPMARDFLGAQVEVDQHTAQRFWVSLAEDEELENAFAWAVVGVRHAQPVRQEVLDHLLAETSDAETSPQEQAVTDQLPATSFVQDIAVAIAVQWSRGRERLVQQLVFLERGESVWSGPALALARGQDSNDFETTEIEFNLPGTGTALVSVSIREQTMAGRATVRLTNVNDDPVRVTASELISKDESRPLDDWSMELAPGDRFERTIDETFRGGQISVIAGT